MVNSCPQCGLINPPTAERCDCGYDLVNRPLTNAPPISLRALLFSLNGRIGRSTYWLKFCLPFTVIYLALLYLDFELGTLNREKVLGIFSGIFALLVSYPCIAVSVKRCHDRNRSGLFLLVGLLPVLNLWVSIELGLLAGTVGPNRFGLPEPRTIWEPKRMPTITAYSTSVDFPAFLGRMACLSPRSVTQPCRYDTLYLDIGRPAS